MKNKLAISAAMALLSAVFSSTKAVASSNDSDVLYLGVEGGISAPVVEKFKKEIEGTKTTGILKKSEMYGALIGYKFYPGMAIEFSWQRKPHYRLNISVPQASFGALATADKISGDVKLDSQLFLVGIVYDLQKINNFTPYIGVEFGVANIKMKEKIYNSTIHTVALPNYNTPAKDIPFEEMKIKKTNTYSPAFQLSLGVTTPEIIPNVSMYAAARLQLIYRAKMKYSVQTEASVVQSVGGALGTPNIPAMPATSKPGTIRQSILVGEIVAGITYNLPF